MHDVRAEGQCHQRRRSPPHARDVQGAPQLANGRDAAAAAAAATAAATHVGKVGQRWKSSRFIGRCKWRQSDPLSLSHKCSGK
jgi:hypothetical protein